MMDKIQFMTSEATKTARYLIPEGLYDYDDTEVQLLTAKLSHEHRLTDEAEVLSCAFTQLSDADIKITSRRSSCQHDLLSAN
jgi:hypothetical protein